MRRKDCESVVAFTIKLIHARPDAKADDVCKAISYAAELARLDRRAAAFEPTATERAARVRILGDVAALAAKWRGSARDGGTTIKFVLPRPYKLPDVVIRVPLVY